MRTLPMTYPQARSSQLGEFMRRREVIKLLGGAAVAWPIAARAQHATMPVVGFVSFAEREATLQASWYRAFHDGLQELGWMPGSNISIEYRFADSDPGRLAALAHELVRLKPNAIFVPTRPALPTVKDATATIPIVFVSLGDPIAEGWVASLARPSGNLTGVAGLSPELAGKRLELLRELVPSLAKVAVLWNPANRAEGVAVKATETAAHSSECPWLSSTPATQATSFGRSRRSHRAVQRLLSCCPIRCS
jgi:putative ABC transport system substrate-binding protein